MSKPWPLIQIRDCLAESFAGDWGSDPQPANAHVLRATDIDDNGNITGQGALRRLPTNKLQAKRLQDGDILLEGSGGGPGKPVGRVAYFFSDRHPGPAATSNFFKTLRPNRNRMAPRFLFWKLLWFYMQPELLTLQQQTTGIINLNFNEYLDAKINVPSGFPEQSLVAKILDTLDTAIRETEAIIGKLKAVKHGLLHDLLTRGIDANGDLRPMPSEAPHLYSMSPLGWIPRQWIIGSVTDFAPEDRQCILTGPFGADLGSDDFKLDGVPVLRIGNVQSGYIDFRNMQYVTAQKANVLRKYTLQEWDLLFARQGATTGRNALADKNCVGSLFNYHIIRVAVDRNKCHPVYLFARFNSLSAKEQVDQAKGRGTREGINSEQISSLRIPFPDIEEQNRVVERIEAFEKKITREQTMLSKLKLQKSGLMDDLLTGRVRVTPLLDGAMRETAGMDV